MLKNSKNNLKVEIRVRKAQNIAQKTMGLIFSKENEALILNTRFGIHTLFMKYPIDVVILDKDKKVVKLKKSLKSNRFFVWNPKYDLVLELPEGSINKLKITKNIQLEWD